MKNYIPLLLILIISCQSTSHEKAIGVIAAPRFEIEKPIEKMASTSEIFSVDNSKDTVLISDKGGFVKIPANCFENENGEEVSKEIQLKFEEYLTPSEILLSGIPMVYMDDQDSMNFQSAGMCEILATDEHNNNLKIKEGKSIDVGLRNMAQDNDYNLYYFDTLQGNWIEKQKELNTIEKPLPIVPVKLDDIDPNRILSINIENHKFRPLYKMWHKSKFKVYGRQSFAKSDSSVWWYDMRIKPTKNPDLYKITFIGINENSKQIKYALIVQPTISEVNYKAEMKNFKTNMLAYVESIELAKLKQIQFEKEQKLQEKQFKKQLIVDSLNLIIQNREDSLALLERTNNEIAKIEVMRTFSINKMGIYNCDRFYKQQILATKNIKMLIGNESIIFEKAYLISSKDNAVLNYIPINYHSYLISLSNQNYDFIGIKNSKIFHTRINNINSNFNKTELILNEIPMENLKLLLD